MGGRLVQPGVPPPGSCPVGGWGHLPHAETPRKCCSESEAGFTGVLLQRGFAEDVDGEGVWERGQLLEHGLPGRAGCLRQQRGHQPGTRRLTWGCC